MSKKKKKKKGLQSLAEFMDSAKPRAPKPASPPRRLPSTKRPPSKRLPPAPSPNAASLDPKPKISRHAAQGSARSAEDQRAWQAAYSDVRPLAQPGRKFGSQRKPIPRDREHPAASDQARAAQSRAAEELARAHLDALVAGGVRFSVTHDDDTVTGLRHGAHASMLNTLPGITPHARIDLHGLRGAEAKQEVTRFIRGRHQKGDRVLLIIHGQGRHSEGGIGVLKHQVVHALTKGGGAPLVAAFCTAPSKLGGNGAMLVRLA